MPFRSSLSFSDSWTSIPSETGRLQEPSAALASCARCRPGLWRRLQRGTCGSWRLRLPWRAADGSEERNLRSHALGSLNDVLALWRLNVDSVYFDVDRSMISVYSGLNAILRQA